MKWPLLLSLCAIQLASAQHHAMEEMPAFNATGDEPMSYALLPADKSYFYIHVTMMVLAFWVLMPIGIMLGIAKSSLHVPVQLGAFVFAMVGFFFAKLYGHSTPHLYAGNSHHTLGWILFLFLCVQMLVGVIRKISNAIARNTSYQILDPETEERRQSESSGETLQNGEFDFDKEDYLPQSRLYTFVSTYTPTLVKNAFVAVAYNSFTKVVCKYYHMVMGRTFIVLAFVQTLSGLVVYHGVCRSWEVLGCIAHLIKGGIFFFYGIITFGRYLGAFANRGWAWNEGSSSYSFEMIESCLIFVYGITNTWMEHFGQDSAWTHKDLEHASLAFMWWWCGLVGILVESRAIRRLLERSTTSTLSLNPFPALTVLMTGISMGNHHQDTAYSTNIHFMWGLLLSCAAICRFITYISLYRNTPNDTLPTRPPSELLGAFLLICGSILFMASNSGTMTWLRRNQVDSMFLMNACVALTAMTLTYVAFLQIIKAWAVRREVRKMTNITQF
ncbi:uncharacterized protein EV154DRAFT_498522 [Mucor mucedo]|uniref:uncharacterized protein n=1 Tax=Mucor mucedo TaxID=29922 RepID=UPI00221FC374|nr:uncharacterized protein EV154DRAFT_498522 [Mucor mucedo]KAI7894363.1 hypothetical protein EV154DRAFT_498522 [Mucor mucedo]